MNALLDIRQPRTPFVKLHRATHPRPITALMRFHPPLLIANPTAGAGRRASMLPALRDGLGVSPEAVVDDLASAPGRVLQRMTSDTSVVIFGGDGTVNQLLPTLMEARCPVAVFPAGTVNDLARERQMPQDVEAFVGMVRHGDVHPIDVLTANGRPFVTYGAVGLGARTSGWAHRIRPLLAPTRRVAPFLQAPANLAATILLDQGYRRHLRVENSQESVEGMTPGVYVGNVTHLNRNVRLAPDAAGDDGRLEAYVLKSRNRVSLLATLFRTQVKGTVYAVPDAIQTFRGSWLRVTALDRKPMDVFGDGEKLTTSEVVEFQVEAGALHMLRPVRRG